MQIASLQKALIKREEGEPSARRRRQSGFTLVELLAVVVILVILAGIGFVVVNNQIENSRIGADQANLRTIADAVNRYMMDNPGKVSQLSDLIPNYLAQAPSDPWKSGQSYSISGSNGTVTITSPHGSSIQLKY